MDSLHYFPVEPHTSYESINVVSCDDFTIDECDIIKNYTSEWIESVRLDVGVSAFKAREENEENEWISRKLLKVLSRVNKEYFQFDIIDLLEQPIVMKYETGRAGLDYHLDVGPHKPVCWRKLAYSLYLNDDFEGGELEIMHGRNKYNELTGLRTAKAKIIKGYKSQMIIFPTYLLHKVNPLVSGTRWTMVGWIHGASFR